MIADIVTAASSAMQHLRVISLSGFVVLALLLADCASATAQSPEHCGVLGKDRERLACYDRWFAQRKPKADSVAGAPVAAPQTAPPAEDQEASFGSELLRTSRRAQPAGGAPARKIQAQIQKLSRGPRDKRTYALSNGQIWRQTKSKAVSIRRGDTITISRSRSGSYTMATQKGAITKVVRVR